MEFVMSNYPIHGYRAWMSFENTDSTMNNIFNIYDLCMRSAAIVRLQEGQDEQTCQS